MPTFEHHSSVRGFHVYQSVWTPIIGEVLNCVRKTSNRHDPFAVKMVKSPIGVVGHVPKYISSICSLFLRKGGTIVCKILGSRQYSRDLPQGGHVFGAMFVGV